jgi:phosphorylcholine metabolism protein LicD
VTTKDARVTALVTTVEILDELGLDYWLCNGTLLGLVRDGELIPWDGDLDFGLGHLEDRAAIRRAFESRGMIVQDDGSGSDYLTFIFMGTKVDLNFFAPQGDEMVTLWKVPKNSGWIRYIVAICSRMRLPIASIQCLWALEGYAQPTTALFPLGEATFYGKSMSVPRTPEVILEYTYGSEWKTPRRDYDWRRDGEHNAYG